MYTYIYTHTYMHIHKCTYTYIYVYMSATWQILFRNTLSNKPAVPVQLKSIEIQLQPSNPDSHNVFQIFESPAQIHDIQLKSTYIQRNSSCSIPTLTDINQNVKPHQNHLHIYVCIYVYIPIKSIHRYIYIYTYICVPSAQCGQRNKYNNV